MAVLADFFSAVAAWAAVASAVAAWTAVVVAVFKRDGKTCHHHYYHPPHHLMAKRQVAVAQVRRLAEAGAGVGGGTGEFSLAAFYEAQEAIGIIEDAVLGVGVLGGGPPGPPAALARLRSAFPRLYALRDRST